jgi:aminobenzoyl-glutamate utilization protein B
MVPSAPGHGEGHNSGLPMMIAAAIAAKQVMIAHKIPGRLMIWPGVAEELLATKAFYVREGMFKASMPISLPMSVPVSAPAMAILA